MWGGCPSSHKGACSASVRPLFGLCIIRQFLALTIESSTLSYFLFPPTNPIKIISKLCAFSKYISMLMLWYWHCSKHYIIFYLERKLSTKKIHLFWAKCAGTCMYIQIRLDLHKYINELTLDTFFSILNISSRQPLFYISCLGPECECVKRGWPKTGVNSDKHYC